MSACFITGTVISSVQSPRNKEHRIIKVETFPAGACAACEGKALCGSSKQRVLELETDKLFTSGENVELSIQSSSGTMATFFLYASGTVLGLILSLTSYLALGRSEITAAIIFIATEIVCFLAAIVLLRKYFKNKIRISRTL